MGKDGLRGPDGQGYAGPMGPPGPRGPPGEDAYDDGSRDDPVCTFATNIEDDGVFTAYVCAQIEDNDENSTRWVKLDSSTGNFGDTIYQDIVEGHHILGGCSLNEKGAIYNRGSRFRYTERADDSWTLSAANSKCIGGINQGSSYIDSGNLVRDVVSQSTSGECGVAVTSEQLYACVTVEDDNDNTIRAWQSKGASDGPDFRRGEYSNLQYSNTCRLDDPQVFALDRTFRNVKETSAADISFLESPSQKRGMTCVSRRPAEYPIYIDQKFEMTAQTPLSCPEQMDSVPECKSLLTEDFDPGYTNCYVKTDELQVHPADRNHLRDHYCCQSRENHLGGMAYEKCYNPIFTIRSITD